MLSVFFYRKDPCHVRKCNIWLVFQKIPQEIKILLLQHLRLLPLTHHTIPFIKQNYKLSARPDIDFPQQARYPVS